MSAHRLSAKIATGAASLILAAGLGLVAGGAQAQAAEAGSPSLTLGGLTLDTQGPLSLGEDQPSLSLGIAPTRNSLPLSASPLPQGIAPAADPSGGLGTRLSIGQPLGLDFLGGSVDWEASATVEQAQRGEAYGLSLSLGSMAESPAAPPSDLRIGLTYGREPAADEHGVILDFSYSF